MQTKNKYEKMTSEEFQNILAEILDELSGDEILAIPGAYEVFSEHFNNEVLEKWSEEND